APDPERLRRLLNQHPPPLQGARTAEFQRPAYKRGVAFSVSHVIADRLGSDDAGGYCRNITTQASRRGIDDQIEHATRDVAEADTTCRPQFLEGLRQGLGTLRCPVRDNDLGGR